MLKKLGPWTMTPDACGAYRALVGKDGEEIANRFAFIEKTPRVRIRDYNLGTQWDWNDRGDKIAERRQWEDFLNWASGDKGDGPEDQESRDWCDRVLVALGYELEN